MEDNKSFYRKIIIVIGINMIIIITLMAHYITDSLGENW